MATQSDLEKLRKQLSDLDAKLKSMQGNSPQRDPRFDLTMANQNYANLMRDQQAKLAAERGQFTQGRLMGAPSMQSFPPGFNNEPEMTPQQYAEANKFMEDNIARIIAENPNAKNFLPKPIDSTDGMSKAQQEAIKAFRYNQFVTQARGGVPTQFGRPRPVAPIIPIPQKPQMEDYNNFLQQGIQNSNTMNQGAMTDFANMQPRMQPTQPATANPAMPIAGQGMQQPKQAPAPRKFSTVKAPPARFG
jgi:hypothetical protein